MKTRVKEDTKDTECEVIGNPGSHCLILSVFHKELNSQLSCISHFENRNYYYSLNINPWKGYFSYYFLKVYSDWKVDIPRFNHQNKQKNPTTTKYREQNN